MIRKRLYSLTGICMATLLYTVPVCAAENTTESSTGLAVINSTGQPSRQARQLLLMHLNVMNQDLLYLKLLNHRKDAYEFIRLYSC